ncbi:MAG: SH3 domain-containing protein, partial [Spirochaetota bacterium]
GKGDGWVHSSALTAKQIVLKAGDKDVQQSASSSEVALAGKGFNKEVEAEYKEKNNIDYTWIDQMEKIVFPPDKLLAFLSEGGLKPVEGGAQ